MSPGSTSGMPSEGRHNPAQSEGWCGSWTPLDSTPGGPHLEYSLDDPPHIVASQHPGASKHHGGGADNSWTGERAPSGTRRGEAQESYVMVAKQEKLIHPIMVMCNSRQLKQHAGHLVRCYYESIV